MYDVYNSLINSACNWGNYFTCTCTCTFTYMYIYIHVDYEEYMCMKDGHSMFTKSGVYNVFYMIME